MQAFHNDQKIKDKYLTRVTEHERADEIVKGQYWNDGKGCAVGCTIHGSNHGAYETELGIPRWMARLEDTIFEGLSVEESKPWPRNFLETITPGQDLEKVKIPMLIFIVESARGNFDHERFPNKLKYIDGVLAELKKTPIDLKALREARQKSSTDAAYAAYAADAAAAYAAYAYAADAAADAAAAYAADAAADAAERSSIWRSAREKEFSKFADKLLELIRDTSHQGKLP